MNFTAPTPIQAQAIPAALQGRDILGSAATGTGKTGAFGIPLIAHLMEHTDHAALVMTPTRELAAQVVASLQQMIPVAGINTALLIGGEAMPRQLRQLQKHPRLIVGTPGRINDHLLRRSLSLANVRFLVLDETDRMLDMGFGVQIDKIVAHLPGERQTLLFSATLPAGIVKLSSKYMKNPERISAGSTVAAAPNIKQELIQVGDHEKYPTLLEQLRAHEGSAIIFVKTKWGADKLAEKLSREKLQADAIHGDLRQSRRDRVIQSFRDRKFRFLVATDLAARGLDVPHIGLVINYDLPQQPEDYIHRIGRTARAGASGKAINFLTSADRPKWNAIHRMMNPGAAPERAPRQERSYKPAEKSREKRRYDHKSRDGDARDHKSREHGPRDHGPREHGPRDHTPRDDKAYGHKPRDHKPRDHKPRDGETRDPHSRDRRAPAAHGHEPRSHESRGHEPRAHESRGHHPRGAEMRGQDGPAKRADGTHFSRDKKPHGKGWGARKPMNKQGGGHGKA
ncbi:MAG: DEAD/DEAH box helicase [Alphaproteobacteria bacterium]|nr:DEAD/DEAH box helicase [Alphaproteobacteria bacterium]